MSTILCFSVNMGCCVYINEEKQLILANGCNITKSEKCKGVWILSVPTVYIYFLKGFQFFFFFFLQCKCKKISHIIVVWMRLDTRGEGILFKQF